MTDHTLSFWECPEQLARSRRQREAWRQLGSVRYLVSNCQQAIQAAEDDQLARAWSLLQQAEVDRYVRYHAQHECGQVSSPVDADLLLRHLRGYFAAALAARAALFTDTDSLLRWLHEAAALWGATRPAEGLAVPPAAGAAVATRRDGWAESMQPARILDDHFRALGQLLGGWRVGAARDCAAVLLSGGRGVARRLTLPVLGFEATGRVLRLGVELLRDGTGECYPDPQRLGLLPMTHAFLGAAGTAWTEALREAGADRAAGYDARWWVVAPDTGPGPQVLDGASTGAALGVALVLLLRGHPIDPTVALTAEMLSGGRLKEVNAVGPKSRAFFAISPPLKYVVVHSDNLHEVQRAAAEAKRDPNAAVRTATTLAEAMRHMSGLPTDLLHYYEALIAAPEGDKGDPAPAFGGRSLAALYVTPDFLPIELERERKQPDGQKCADASTPSSHLLGPEVRRLVEDTLFGKADSGERLSWDQARDEWGKERARAIILGAPGQGKSVLTQMLASEIAEAGRQGLVGGSDPVRLEDLLLPMVLPLNLLLATRLPEGLDPDAPLRAVLANLLEKTTGCSPDAACYLAKHAHEGRSWLILDALDEVGADPVSAGARDRLFELLRRPEWRCRVLITTRPYGYDPATLRLGEARFRLAPLSDNQQRTLIGNWFRHTSAEALAGRERVESLRNRPAVQGMAQNAFLLSLLCGIAEASEVPADITRTQVYDCALRRILGGERRAAQWLACLRELAFRLFRQDDSNLLMPEEDLIDFVRESRLAPQLEEGETRAEEGERSRSDQEVAIGLIDELSRKKLLVRVRGRGAMMIAHRSFAEFLTARYLARRVKEQGWKRSQVIWTEGEDRQVADLVDHKAWLPEWQEVIVFLGGLLERPRPLIELLAGVSPGEVPDDDFRHRLPLASRALAETPPELRKGLVDLVDRITTEHFGLWWSRCSDNTLAAINHLTVALPSLAVLNGRVMGEEPLSGNNSLLACLLELLRDAPWDVRSVAARAVDCLNPDKTQYAELWSLHTDQCEEEIRRDLIRTVGLKKHGITVLEMLLRGAPSMESFYQDVTMRTGLKPESVVKLTHQVFNRILQTISDRRRGLELPKVPAENEVAEVTLLRLRHLLRDADEKARSRAAEAVGHLQAGYRGLRFWGMVIRDGDEEHPTITVKPIDELGE